MSYSSNPLLPKARAEAVRLVVEDHLSITTAARKSGVHRTTLWRWQIVTDQIAKQAASFALLH